MKRLRHSVKGLAIALGAAFAMLLVTTASLAQSPAAADPMMTMAKGGSCEDMGHDGKASCTPRCAVMCQALIVEPDVVLLKFVWLRPLYIENVTILVGVGRDADDPPPRTALR